MMLTDHLRGGALVLSALVVSCGARTALEGAEESIDPAPDAPCSDEGLVSGPEGWARALGLSGSSTSWRAVDVVVGPEGRISIASLVVGSVTLGCVELEQRGESDVLVASFTAQGDVVFARRFGEPGRWANAAFLGTDAEGNLTIAGSAYGDRPIYFGAEAVDADLFVASFDPAGELRFARGAELEDGELTLTGAGVSALGELTLTASLRGDIDLGAGPIDGSVQDQGSHLLLATWDRDGDLRRAGIHGDGFGFPYALAVDHEGYVALSGETEAGQFVALLDESGNELWSRSPEAATLAFDSAGALLAGRRGLDTPYPLVTALRTSDGAVLWEAADVTWKGSEAEWPPYASSIVAIGDGRSTVAASLLGSADMGLGPVASVGGFDALLITLSAGGQVVAQRRIGGVADATVRSIASLGEGRLVVAMVAQQPQDLGLGPLPTACALCEHAIIAVLNAP
jgi:hypothetical protein